MSSLHLQRRPFSFPRLILALGIVAVVAGTLGVMYQNNSLEAYLVRKKVVTPWFTLDEQDVFSGATIPANTNVVFHLPFDFTTIDRQVLLGLKGKTVRYWGYCFPQNYDPSVVTNRTGFPGQMFLSEKERAVRAEQEAARQPQFSLQHLPTKAEIARLQERSTSTIRHQIDTFKPGMLCYIMTEAPMAIGLDEDNDSINNKLEAEIGTDPGNPDSDGDGIVDGKEYQTGTNPVLRDTDGDGIIDGIEDRNWNGRVDATETDPRTKDTDRDGLCDGMCRERLSNGQQLYAGEDRNLNGTVDDGETDPLLIDSKHDGYGDYQRFLQCILDGRSDC